MRGVVATDALIGTFTDLDDPSLDANRCFLYHVIGGGTGDWDVPVGGMGAVTGELARAAREAGAELVTGAEVHRGRARRRGALPHDGAEHASTPAPCSRTSPVVLDRLLDVGAARCCDRAAGRRDARRAARQRRSGDDVPCPRRRERLRRSPSPRAPRSR